MKLEAAHKSAAALIDHMRPCCDRIEIAGSIRRECPEVKDIEIVCIPSWIHRQKEEANRNLFQQTVQVNALYEMLAKSESINWIKPGARQIEKWHINADGKYWRGLIPQGKFDVPSDIKLDIFLARPENWGVIYAIRTGSADFSRALVTYARDRTPYRVDGGYLTREGKPFDCLEEEELFASLSLEWVDASLRRGERDLAVHQ